MAIFADWPEYRTRREECKARFGDIHAAGQGVSGIRRAMLVEPRHGIVDELEAGIK